MTDTPIPLFEGAVVTWSPLDDGKGEVNLTGTPLRPPNPNDWGTVAVHPLDEVARLVARVEAQATQLADAHAVIRRLLDPDVCIDGQDPDAYPEIWCWPNGTFEHITDGQRAAIAAARATEDASHE